MEKYAYYKFATFKRGYEYEEIFRGNFNLRNTTSNNVKGCHDFQRYS